MRQWIVILLAFFFSASCFSATSDHLIPVDQLKLGKSGSTADKAFTFQQDLGVNNPAIKSNKTNQDIQFFSNTLKLGKGASANETLSFDLGLGSSNPQLRYNTSTSKIEFTNNGSIYTPLGSMFTSATSQQRLEYAYITNTCTGVGTPNSGTWIQSVSTSATGYCLITFATGMFSSSPTCFATPAYGSASGSTTTIYSLGTASVQTYSTVSSAGTPNTNSHYLVCMGPR